MSDFSLTRLRLLDALVRRCFDVLLATAGLVLLSPVMLLIAVAVVAESGFPVFYSQTRLGHSRRHISMFKFRKFNEDRGASEFPLTMNDDDRMTRVGRILAATKLDELPQLFNILRGDMAVVGPRPESLAFADCFTREHSDIFDHKPGIFGPSQVAFRSEADLYPSEQDPVKFYREVIFPLKADLDLSYYRRRNLILDVGWVVRGVLAVVGMTFVQPRVRLDHRGLRLDTAASGGSGLRQAAGTRLASPIPGEFAAMSRTLAKGQTE